MTFFSQFNDFSSLFTAKAKFNRIDGLLLGSEVRLSGVVVGKVIKIGLNQNKPEVLISLNKGIGIPSDSSISIQTDGLFGGKYLSLEPGGSFDHIKNGDEIIFTEDSMLIEELLSKIIKIGENKL